jgi:hypothetical protein
MTRHRCVGRAVAVVSAAGGQLNDQLDAVGPQPAVGDVRPPHLFGQPGIAAGRYRHELAETRRVPLLTGGRSLGRPRRHIELIDRQPDPESTTFEHMSEGTAGVRQFSG